MKKACFILLITISILNVGCTKAQLTIPNFEHQQLNDWLHIIKYKDYNTNIGVYVGKESILLIDPTIGSEKEQILLEAIKSISDKPIKYVLNTHSHPDHSGSNKYFADLGATIISQENALYSSAFTQETFKDSYTLDFEGETIGMIHNSAHTFDDALIYFKNSNALFMGDTFMTNWYPFFHHGAGSKGHFEILNKALELANNQTVIVPAHGMLRTDKKHLQQFVITSGKWVKRIGLLNNNGLSSAKMTEDATLIGLEKGFNIPAGSNYFEKIIEKSISADKKAEVELSQSQLTAFVGTYTFEDTNKSEVVYKDSRLIMRREGSYMMELIPLKDGVFHIRGKVPYQHVTFKPTTNSLEYFNGKTVTTASKN